MSSFPQTSSPDSFQFSTNAEGLPDAPDIIISNKEDPGTTQFTADITANGQKLKVNAPTRIFHVINGKVFESLERSPVDAAIEAIKDIIASNFDEIGTQHPES